MRVISWISVLILIGSFLCNPITDPDLWWHIVVGRWILAHREVPHVDYWNLFGSGQPWRAYSWSQEVLYGLIESKWGDVGLGVMQLILGLCLVSTVQLVFGVLAGNHFFGVLLAVLTTAACRPHFSLRPQTAVWIVFALVLLTAELSVRNGLRRRYVAALFCLGCVWANTHLSAVLGLMAVLLWTLPATWSWSDVSRTASLCAGYVAGTFCSPYFGGEWLTLLEKSDHVFVFRVLEEFRPADLTQASTLCLTFGITLLLVLSYTSRRLPPRGAMLLTVVMVTFGGIVVKFLPFALIAIGALTAVWLRDVRFNCEGLTDDDNNNIVRGLALLRVRFLTLHPQTVGACSFFFLCVAWVNIAKAMQQPVNYATTPKKAVDFVEFHTLGHPILNEFATGGYLMYRWSSAEGIPRALVPLDGRTNVNRSDIWSSYRKAATGKREWREYLSAVRPKTVIWSRQSPLTSLLIEVPEWCKVYETGNRISGYAVFITRGQFEAMPGEFISSDCAQSADLQHQEDINKAAVSTQGAREERGS